jgi:hypothetical protein
MAENTKYTTRDRGLRALISVGALALAAGQITGRLKLDPISLGLLALAVLPWLASVVEIAKVAGWELKFREVEREQDRQREELDRVLTFLFENFVTGWELQHLQTLAEHAPGRPFPYTWAQTFEDELKRLLGLGLIERQPGKGFRSLRKENGDAGTHFRITARGREYLRYRESLDRGDRA